MTIALFKFEEYEMLGGARDLLRISQKSNPLKDYFSEHNMYYINYTAKNDSVYPIVKFNYNSIDHTKHMIYQMYDIDNNTYVFDNLSEIYFFYDSRYISQYLECIDIHLYSKEEINTMVDNYLRSIIDNYRRILETQDTLLIDSIKTYRKLIFDMFVKDIFNWIDDEINQRNFTKNQNIKVTMYVNNLINNKFSDPTENYYLKINMAKNKITKYLDSDLHSY